MTSGHSVWKNSPSGLSSALVGVGSEEVALGLEQVGGEAGGAVAVVVAEAGAEGGDGDAVQGGEGDNSRASSAGSWLSMSLKKGSSMRLLSSGLRSVGVGDAVEEAGADDAAAAPDGGDAAEVEAPVFASRPWF
jgi:hypothetical protein